MKAKVKRIMIWPKRKINLGNYNTTELSAGIELVFDKPVPIGGKDVKEAYKSARKVIRDEFIEQYKPYKSLLKKK